MTGSVFDGNLSKTGRHKMDITRADHRARYVTVVLHHQRLGLPWHAQEDCTKKDQACELHLWFALSKLRTEWWSRVVGSAGAETWA